MKNLQQEHQQLLIQIEDVENELQEQLEGQKDLKQIELLQQKLVTLENLLHENDLEQEAQQN